ncbi:OmpA family protein [Maribacter sp. IgM3_T14_3]|uniref:OmpA family protein n=1 Tax=Maribacter sp. IgM3_T14_3 TaxID=3415140 RepID=UPI003C6FA48B
MKFQYIILGILMTCGALNAQTKRELKADKKFEDLSYQDAIETYERIVKKGEANDDVFSNLGDSYFALGNYGKAGIYYDKLSNTQNGYGSKETMYRHVLTLKSDGDYDRADSIMEEFSQQYSEDMRAKLFLKNRNYRGDITKNLGEYELETLSFNSEWADFSPSFYGEQIVFATARDTGTVKKNLHLWDNGYFEDLYVTTKLDSLGNYTSPKPFSNTLNSVNEETSVVFSRDGNTIYFTRSANNDKKIKKSDKGIGHLKLYKAELVDGSWVNQIVLPFNGDSYSVAHPALSPDGKKLYFSSDMPGTSGGSDIFMVSVNEDGTYGAPEHLENGINTEARESFPFITENNVLYFASDGHPGLGGLDVFLVDLNSKNPEVINLGTPINSTADDFSYIVNDENMQGLFASNRNDGIGSDDIYSFVQKANLLKKVQLLAGTVKDLSTGEVLAEVDVTVVANENKNEKFSVKSSEEGVFEIEEYLSSSTYILTATKEGYETNRDTINIKEMEDMKNILVELELMASETDMADMKSGDNLADMMNLSPIYYDFDSATVREDAKPVLNEITEYLKNNPTVYIEIRAHTDARGSSAYNLKLSERRATSTIYYIVSQGVELSRLTGVGLGESELIYDCKNCSKEEHQLNRRTRFIVK